MLMHVADGDLGPMRASLQRDVSSRRRPRHSSVSCKSQQEKPLKRRSEMNYKPSNCKVLHDEAWIKMFHHSRFLNHRLGAVSAMAPPSDCFASGFRTALHQYNDFSLFALMA